MVCPDPGEFALDMNCQTLILALLCVEAAGGRAGDIIRQSKLIIKS